MISRSHFPVPQAGSVYQQSVSAAANRVGKRRTREAKRTILDPASSPSYSIWKFPRARFERALLLTLSYIPKLKPAGAHIGGRERVNEHVRNNQKRTRRKSKSKSKRYIHLFYFLSMILAQRGFFARRGTLSVNVRARKSGWVGCGL